MSKPKLKIKQNEDPVSMFTIGTSYSGEQGQDTLMTMVLKYALNNHKKISMLPKIIGADGSITIRFESKGALLALITRTDDFALQMNVYGVNYDTFFNKNIWEQKLENEVIYPRITIVAYLVSIYFQMQLIERCEDVEIPTDEWFDNAFDKAREDARKDNVQAYEEYLADVRTMDSEYYWLLTKYNVNSMNSIAADQEFETIKN